MTTLTVGLGERSYPIHLVDALPAATVAAEAERVRGRQGRALIVTDSNVGPLYAADLRQALESVGLQVVLVELPAGEASKSLDTISAVLDRALGAGLGRRDLVVALGGGVVGDIAGFAAAILHRGVPLLQVPTSLLAQIDSAVGGKTGVNHAAGKNLIGAFWQPRAVVASLAVLATLPERERRCGLAEGIKHGFIADPALVDEVLANAPALAALEAAPTRSLVAASCRIKAEVVAADEREGGRRAILNFGHTLGHAYEKLLGYGALTHGEAIALGMIQAARVSEAVGVAPAGLEAIVRAPLEAVGLPVDTEASGLPDVPALLAAARSDKKADGSTVMFVTLAAVGRPLIRTLAWDHIGEALRQRSGLQK
ncbi:MAG: 3-dehydroquinate synthase [Deltaproteobacteria bacterium]|nr:3-dehydroquinate synthase [Deltaproteobacteria bacterium]MCB9788453.1 3-dehydroquinate synthase [Deltaproteobacteria bacterium]